jgi:hypothetical protein
MGRWAQRRRNGGGPPPPGAELVSIEAAVIDDSETVIVTYDSSVTATGFDAAAFESEPSGETGVSVSQLSANELTLNMSGSVTGDATLVYTGTKPGITTPQSVAYS